MAGSPTLPKENIDEVILGLLALEPNEVAELDYQTYSSYLKELLIEITSSRRKISGAEVELVRNEFKRIRGKKGRFRIVPKKSKVTANGLGLGGIRKQVKGAQQRLMLAPVGGVPKEKTEFLKDKNRDSDVLSKISNTLDSIVKTLTDINKESKKISDKERKDAESKKRVGKEKEFESKIFDGVKSAVKGILKPFESIWSRIVKFITTVLLGRALIKLLDWFADPNNQAKIQSIIRFFKDHWPTLLALYLRFGTGIGRFIGKLGGILVKGAFKLAGLASKLLARAGLKKFAGAARFLGGPRGKAIATGIGIAADVAVTAGTAFGVQKLIGGGGEPVQKFFGGGSVRIPKFAGGGFANFGNMFKGAAGSGFVSGEKGVDKVPAMLTDGEFVMSTGAVAKYGVDTLEGMNAAGGGTNIPKIMNGTTYAAGGGLIGDINPYNPNQMSDVDFRRYVDGRIEERMSDRRIAELRGRRSNNLPKPIPPRINPSRMLPAAGQSSANSMRAASGVRPPIPATSAIVPYAGSGLVNTGVTRGLSKPPVQRINTNMNVPGGRIRGGSLSAIMAAFEMKQRKDEGQTNVQAGLGAGGAALGGQLGWMGGAKAGALAGAALGSIVPGLGTGVGAAVGAIVGGLAAGYGGAMLGGKLADDFSGVNVAKERASRGVGGNIVGGYGLKAQSFKDAPKTSIITDDKGRPFVGHKAIKNGRLTYVRGSQPGTGTTNPLEMLGRFINPGAYKENDAKLARQKHKEAMVNSLEGFQKQGMALDAQARMMKQMGGNLKDTQNDLNYRKKSAQLAKPNKSRTPVKPPPKSQSKPIVAGGGMGGKRGSGSSPSINSQKPRSQNPTHSSGATRTARSTLGIKK